MEYGNLNTSIFDTNVSLDSNLTMENFSKAETVVFSTIFAIIGLVGLIGNGLVILAVTSDAKMRRSAMNVLLLNLAIADLCNLIVCVPEIALALLQRGWIIPYPATCQILRYLEVLFLYSSLLTQLAVCVERFFAIAIPMKIQLFCSRKKVQMWALILWLVSFASASPYLVYHKLEGTMCKMVMDPTAHLTFKCLECLLFYFLPLFMIVLLYTRISLILWSANLQLHEGGSSLNDGQANETLRTRQKVVKMLIACVFVYFVCYSPIQAIFIAALFKVRFMPPKALRLTLNCMTYGCSAANPLLYSIFSRKFRAKFAEILKCSKRKMSTATVAGKSTYAAPSCNRYVAVEDTDYLEHRLATTRVSIQCNSRVVVQKNGHGYCRQVGTPI